MRKVETKNKAKGLFGFFATIALALGVGVSLAPKEAVKTSAAASVTHSFKSSIPSGWVASITPSGYDGTRGAQFTNKSFTSMTLTYNSTDSFNRVDVTAATNGTVSNTKIKVNIGNQELGSELTLTDSGNKQYSFSGSTFSGNIVVTIRTTNNDKSTYILQVITHTDSDPGTTEPGGPTEPESGEVEITAAKMGYSTSYQTVTKGIDGITFKSTDILLNGTNMQFKASSGKLENTTEMPGDISKISFSQTGSNAFTVNSGATSGSLSAQGTKSTLSMEWDLTGKGHRYFSITRGSGAGYVPSIKITYNTTPPVDIESVSVSPGTATLYAGGTNQKTVQLTAEVSPREANQKVTWKSSNSSIASVDNNGLVTAVNGSATPVTITATAVGDSSKTATALITVIDKAIASLSVTGTPKTKEYYKGENFDLTGLTATATYNNGDTAVIAHNQLTVFETPLKSTDTSVTIKHGGQQDVVEGITVLDRELVSLQVSGELTKKDYFVGDSFSPAGLTVNAVYSDDHTENVTNQVTYSHSKMTQSLEEIEVSYSLVRNYPSPVTVKTKISDFTVTPVLLTSLEVKTLPSKTTFTLGEAFSASGLVVTESYNNGDKNNITSGFTLSEVNTMELGRQIVKVQKGGLSTEFEITVTNEGAKVGDVEKYAADLFFSEYIEGSSQNKGLEIYNGTGYSVDLSDYRIHQYNNGSSSANPVLQLEGTLNHGEVFVVVTDESKAAMQNVADESLAYNSVAHFNGNDAVALVKNYTPIDVIGYIGYDPGSSWSVGSGSTLDKTLVRKSSVHEGFVPTKTSENSLENSSEWEVYPIDTTTYLGSHVFDGGLEKGDVSYEEQALAFANFVKRAASVKPEAKPGLKRAIEEESLLIPPTWEEVQEEKGAMDPESLVVFETSTDPEIAAGREVYGELLEENESAFADASAFHAYIMGLTSEGDIATVDCAANFELAKEEWNKLSEEAREVFLEASNTGYTEGRSRLLHWTFVNGWEFNGVVLQEQALGGRSTLNKDSVNFNIVATVLIGVIGLTTLAGYYFLRKKKHA